MNWHPYAKLFPMLEEDKLQELAEDIAANGQHHPVIVDEKGLILDGRNRAAACALAQVEPATKVFKGDDAEKLAFVLSGNLHRRHLDTAQRSMVAEKLAGLKQGGKKADGGIPLSQPTQAEVAKMFNVSVDSVKQARKILKTATPEIVAAVERGELSLNAAMATVTPQVVNPATKLSQQHRHDGEHVESKVYAIGKANVAITQLKAIPSTNKFLDALDRVQSWIGSQRSGTTNRPMPEDAEPEVETKAPSFIHIQRTLIRMGAVKKRHPQLIQIARDALSRLTADARCEFLACQLHQLTLEQRGQLMESLPT